MSEAVQLKPGIAKKIALHASSAARKAYSSIFIYSCYFAFAFVVHLTSPPPPPTHRLQNKMMCDVLKEYLSVV